MPTTKRALASALIGGIALLTVGCTPADPITDPAAWVSAQDHVADAELRPYDDARGEDDAYLAVTLDDGLDDDTVHEIVDHIKERFDDLPGAPSLEVDVDGFIGHVYPGAVTFSDGIADPDLLRALWLRADGRATSYGDRFALSSTSHPVAIAPAEDVAQLALDLDGAVSYEHDVRHNRSVESEDGTAGVQWETSLQMEFAIDEDAVGVFAALQDEYPGTTGWVSTSGEHTSGSIVFSPDDVSFDEVASGGLVDATLFDELEIGWGAAVGDVATFASDFADPTLRRVLDEVGGIDGVLRVASPVITRTAAGVVIDDASTLDDLAAFTDATGIPVTVDFLRAPVLFGAFPNSVFSVASDADPAHLDALRTIAPLPGIARVNVTDLDSGLVVRGDVDDEEIETALTALAALPETNEIVYVGVRIPSPPFSETDSALGRLHVGVPGIEQDSAVANLDEQYRDLAQRIGDAWSDALG